MDEADGKGAVRRRARARRPVERRPLGRPTGLLVGALRRVDAGDVLSTPLEPEDTDDVRTWNDAVFGSAPPWVVGLLRLRDAIAGAFGLRHAGGAAPRGFPQVAESEDEVLTGLDDRHLTFRVSVRRVGGEVAVATAVEIHNVVGRAYWAVVRWVHPWVVRALLRRVPRPLPGPRAAR